MKVFRICGNDNSGKTTTLEYIVRDMTSRGFKIATGKDFTDLDFTIDKLGKNTMRHRIAGSKTVVARGLNETSLLVQRRMGLNEILKQLMNYDFCVLEGFNNAHLPKIITARTWEEVDSFLDSDTIAISGVIANDLTVSEYKGIPVFNGILSYKKLVELILEKVGECNLDDPSLKDRVNKELPPQPRRKTLSERRAAIIEKENIKKAQAVKAASADSSRRMPKKIPSRKNPDQDSAK